MNIDKSIMTIDTYNKIAKKYDEAYEKIYYEEELKAFLKLLKKDDTVLDAGCGTGLVSDYLYTKGMNVFAIDTSENMINIAKEKNENVICEKMDVRNINFEDDTFNAIFCYAVLIHINKKEAFEVLKIFYKLLKKDGIVFINVMEEKVSDEEIIVKESLDNNYQTWYQYYNKAELLQQLELIGFEIIDIKDRIFDDEEYKFEEQAYLRNEFSIYAKKYSN